MTVRQLLRETDSVELSSWAAFFQAEAERLESERQSAELEARLSR